MRTVAAKALRVAASVLDSALTYAEDHSEWFNESRLDTRLSFTHYHLCALARRIERGAQ